MALLALHADELADSCIEPPEALSFLPNPPTGPAFLFDALAVVFVLAEEPISARAKVLFLRVVVCLWHLPLFARSAASSKFAWRGRNAGPRGDVLQSRRRVGNACGTASGLRDIALLFTCRSAKFTCREVCFESNTNNLLQP